MSRKIKKPVQLSPSLKNSSRENSILDPGEFAGRFKYIFGGLLFFAICFAIYTLYCAYARRRKTQNVGVLVSLVRPTKPIVGETITIRIRFRRIDGKFLPASSQIFKDFEENITIDPESENLERHVAVLKETNKSNNFISGKFSVRKSGAYEINVRYPILRYSFLPYSVCLTHVEPFKLQVFPGSPSPKYMDFETHNSRILCLTAGIQFYFKILAEDQYGNRCEIQDVDLEKFAFQLYYMGNSVPVEHEFCYHKSKSKETNTDENAELITDTCSVNVCLNITVNQPGIYNCILKYDNYEVRKGHGSQKVLVCLKTSEETELRSMFSQMNVPGTLIYSSECRLWAVEDEDGFKDYYLGITANSVAFATYKIPLMLYPDMSFPINARTKIMFYGTEATSGGDEKVTFLVQDGIRPSVRVEMDASPGRVFIVVFAHYQGFLLTNLKVSFQEKKANLRNRISSYFSGFWFSSEKVLQIQHGNLIRSSLKQVPQHSDDWLLPFKIQYEGAPLPPTVMKPVKDSGTGQQEWINRLCGEFFNVQSESGMFQRLPGSKLLHPVSSTVSNQPLECYRLAGQILAKAIVETLLRGICTQLTHVRLSRSFLSFILGFPIVFKFLESDEPKYFLEEILPILEADINSQHYTFTFLPSGTSDTNANAMNLIPNGSNIPVTNANKEHYLNLLTNYRLIHKVEQEMTAFRNGFYHVIDKDKLSDFLEGDLQKLISGGCAFSISDLQKHHRVVNQVENGLIQAISNQSINTKKLLKWFWVAAENLSEEEQSYLVFFTTGSFSLPSCGLSDLNPHFTINLSGTFNQLPRGLPISNEIVLGCHACFDSFEQSLLQAIKPESERILLPTTNEICGRLHYAEEGFYEEDEYNMEMVEDANANAETQGNTTAHNNDEGPGIIDPILNWLRGFSNI